MKRVLSAFVMLCLLVVMSACGGQAQDPPTQTLVGTWLWMGLPYYEFEADGRGTMAGMSLRWTTHNGIISICYTPDLCGATCFAPAEWYYSIDGNELTLTSRVIADLTFTYTRQ